MVIFITLFAINIVAKSILGDSINLSINLCRRNPESFNLFLSEGDSEKKAISDPEINPEMGPEIDPEIDPEMYPEMDPEMDPEINPEMDQKWIQKWIQKCIEK